MEYFDAKLQQFPHSAKYFLGFQLKASRNFRISNNLLEILIYLTIKDIQLLHIIEVLRRKTFAVRYFMKQILTEEFEETATIDILGVTSHDVATERPIEAQHLSVYLRCCLNLAEAVSFLSSRIQRE